MSWNNLCDNYDCNASNHCRCFIDTDRWDSSWIQDHRIRYTQFNCYNDANNVDFDFCPIDGFHSWKSTSASSSSLIAESKSTNVIESYSSFDPVNTSQTSINAQIESVQESTCNYGTITLECNVILVFSLPDFPILDSGLINLYSSPQLVEHNCQKHHSTIISDPYVDFFNYPTNKSPRKDSSFNSRSFKRLLLFIKYRLNAFFTYMALFIIVIIFGTIIYIDILKYGYNTGLRRKKRQRFERKQFAYSHRIFKPPVIRRPTCLNIPDLQTIPEEENESIF